MPKDKKQKLVLTIGEERPGFSAHLGEIVYIASPGHKWGREEKPPRFQFVNEELSAEEERDLLTKLWKRDFNRSVWTSRLVANLDWDKNQVYETNDKPDRGEDLEEAIDIVTGGRGGKPEEVLWRPFFKKEGEHYRFKPEVWSDYYRDLMEAEHKLRKEEKSKGSWKKLRKALFFTCYHGLRWIGATIIEARDLEKLGRKGVLNSLFQNEQVRQWLAPLWDARD